MAVLVPEQEDISLKERVRRANALWAQSGKNAVLFSIHHDAWKTEDANGWSAFTTVGQTKSDSIANLLYEEFAKLFPSANARKDSSKDGDPDWEADFYIIKNTFCPAVLIENFFMTNRADYELLNTEGSRNKLADVVTNAVKRITL